MEKAGPDLQEVFASIPGADVTEDKEKNIDPYSVAIQKLDTYFSPKQHETFERNVFWTLKPSHDETLEKFMLRCQDQAKCIKCKRVGHFAARCRTTTVRRKYSEEPRPGPSQGFKRQRVHEIETAEERKDQSFIFCVNDGEEFLWLRLGGVTLQLLIDSGCKKNIINEKAWEYTKNNGVKVWKLLFVLGKFDAQISVEDNGKIIEQIKGLQVEIPIDKSVVPVCQHPRRPPIALLSKIEDKLTSLLNSDIIEPVVGGCQWVSPLVTVVKDNGDLRLCVDMRRANAAILRERHIMPTIEDFLPRFTSAKYFSRLDIKEAFHQVELKEESRYITTFITHKGLFQYKRLMYGIVIAPELFQRIMEQILSRCENTVNFIDDILVFGSTENEHDMALKLVLSVLNEHGILLNQEKCLFKVNSLDFLGHTISPDGIKPSNSKVEALQKFRIPNTTEEVRSFLGLVTYVGRFLPNLATITAPLRELIRSGSKFCWGKEQQESFAKLKDLISNVQQLYFFDNTLRTRVIADASPVALGAVLVQFEGPTDFQPRPIAYASKSLTATERRYCQTEKEALALYRKGSSLSRLSVNSTPETFDPENKFMVLAVMESAAIDVQELENTTNSDAILGIVKQCLRSGNWDKDEAKPFLPFKHELGFVGDMLVRGNKLVVPTALKTRMLDIAHEGHPGESVMKRRLRDRVWWPGMDNDAVSRVKACEGCRLVGLPSRPEPISRRPLPSGPWIDIAMDFLGPLPCGSYFLVIIDYYSRYKEVEIMFKITARDTISRLDRIFTRLGYPRTITLDNAKQFKTVSSNGKIDLS
ncbi:uncharacterized protein K02A2.6-like [Armigeres subalbatus]|uniref:uncharacterized protein K02A2.6-like n=1 Tax=Armigeres subalbatus TaxID=124917 RepID=UPI002ED53A1F